MVLLVSVQVFNVRRLDGLQVPEVRLDDHDAVDVEAHPEAFAQGREDHLEVDVVAEHQPEAEHGLEEDDDVHEVDPGQQKSSDAWTDSLQEQHRHDDHQDEVDDDEDADGLQGRVQVGLEEGQPQLGRVSAVHAVSSVGDDAHRHGDGVDGHRDAAVEDVAVPETRSPATFQMNHFVKFQVSSLVLLRAVQRHCRSSVPFFIEPKQTGINSFVFLSVSLWLG